MQLAVFCLLAVSMVVATGYDDDCKLQLCGKRLGVYQATLTRPGNEPDYEVLTFHSDGFFNGIASNQNADFSSFEGTWRCIDKFNIEATDFLFNFASGTTPARLTKGIFKLKLEANDKISGTLNATQYDIASTENSDRSKWIAVFKIDFCVKGYKLLKKCDD